MDDALLIPGTLPQRPSKITPTTPRPGRRRKQLDHGRGLEKAAAFYANILPEATTQEANFRHGHWAARREQIRKHLANTGASVQTLNRWDACGGQCVVQYSPSLEKFRLAANYCKNRHCEPCMRAKANRIAANLRDRLEEQQRTSRPGRSIQHRFITLTLKHNRRPLREQIERLFTSFKKLRAEPCWKNSQDGGAFVLECKRERGSWHPHLHVISQGRWISKHDLVNAWKKITGDSFIVDVQALDRAKDACHYVSKYITKSTNAAVWCTDDTAQEWIIASKGVRTCNTFGTWRKFRLTESKCPTTDWVAIDTLETLIRKAREGEIRAGTILLNLRPPGASDGPPPNEHAPP